MPDLSFQEKSVLGSLAAVVVVSAYYFSHVFSAVAHGGAPNVAEIAALGISLLVALIIVEIIYHSLIAGFSPADARQPTDERDQLIGAKAGRNGGFALAVGAILIVGHIMGNAWFGREAWITPFVTAHLILLAMVVAQVVEYVSQLVYYRRGV